MALAAMFLSSSSYPFSACIVVTMHLASCLTLYALIGSAVSLTPDQWRSQSIYQVVTDRFARTDGSTTAACDPSTGVYCGGTWQGLIQKLDYIQQLGFTAIWISPVVENVHGLTSDGDSYHGYWAQKIVRGSCIDLGDYH